VRRRARRRLIYTSLTREGTLAGVCSFLADLTPLPKPRAIKLTHLAVTASRTLRLVRADLERLGVAMDRYGERDYARTQEIGAAIAFLEYDGLIVSSARWDCDNLIIFTSNHGLNERLDPVCEEQIEWQAWSRANGILNDDM
jgi:hypothetical protein